MKDYEKNCVLCEGRIPEGQNIVVRVNEVSAV